MMNINGSKPCPACGKTISANKDLCFTCMTMYGSLEEFNARKAEAEAAEIAAVKPKKPRKPRAKKVTADTAFVPAPEVAIVV